MREYTVRVVGEPAPQGSKRHVGRGVLVESSAKVKPWRAAVVAAIAESGHAGEALDKPLAVTVTFALKRPTGHLKADGTARDSAPAFPGKRPDLDKLVRSTLDGLTESTAIADDSHVVMLIAYKRFVNHGEPMGATITVRELA